MKNIIVLLFAHSKFTHFIVAFKHCIIVALLTMSRIEHLICEICLFLREIYHEKCIICFSFIFLRKKRTNNASLFVNTETK